MTLYCIKKDNNYMAVDNNEWETFGGWRKKRTPSCYIRSLYNAQKRQNVHGGKIIRVNIKEVCQ